MARRKLRGIQFDSPDERETFHAKESWVPIILGTVPLLILGIVLLVVVWTRFENATVGLVLLGVAVVAILVINVPRIIANLDTDVVVTNKRLYARTGILDIKDQVCDLTNIADVTVDPTIFGRVFDYADVRIQTYAGESDFVLRAIAHAYDMRRAISQGIDASKKPSPRNDRRPDGRPAGDARGARHAFYDSNRC